MANKKIVSALAAFPRDEREKVVVDINGVPTDVFRPEGQSDEEWARVKEKAREDNAQTTIDNTPAQIERGDMTDEEWQKTKELVGRKGDASASGDYVYLKPQGEGKSAFVYPRKPSMTDEEWAAQVAEHKKHPRYGYTKSEKQGGEEDQAMRDRVVEKTVTDPSNKELALSDYDRGVLGRMNEDDRRSFLEARMKNKGKPVSGKAAPAEGSASGGGVLGQMKSLLGKVIPGATSNQSEPAKQYSSATVDPEANGSTDAYGNFRPNTDDPALDRANANGDAAGVEDLQTIKDFGNAAGDVAKQIGSSALSAIAPAPLQKVSSEPTPNPIGEGLGTAAGLVAGGMGIGAKPPEAFPGMADPLDPAVAPVQPMPQQQGMPPSGSVSGAGNMPSGFKVAQADPAAMAQYKESAANARAAAEDFQFTSESQMSHQKRMIQETAKNVALEQAESAKLAKLAGDAKITAANENQRYRAAQQHVMQQAREAASNPVDPNRYWNNKSDGQRAAAIIAGACFGFTGQGMNYLQRIDSLIENDMRTQEGDRASKVRGLEGEAAQLGEAGRAALENGATIAEAHLIEKQSRLEGVRAQLDNLGLKLTQSDQVMRYQQINQELAAKSAQLDAQGATLAQTQADSINENRYKNASLAQQSWAVNAKLGAKGGPNGLQDLKPGQQERITELLGLGKQMGAMASQYREKVGTFSGLMQHVPMNASSAAQWADTDSTLHAQAIGTVLEKGKLTDADFPKYRDRVIPNATETRGAAENKIKNLIKYARTKYETELQGLEGANVYIKQGVIPSPQAYEQSMLEEAGMSAPLKSERPVK